jgi:hypothetical protein
MYFGLHCKRDGRDRTDRQDTNEKAANIIVHRCAKKHNGYHQHENKACCQAPAPRRHRVKIHEWQASQHKLMHPIRPARHHSL